MGDCITTYTGKHFDPTHPAEELICIEDIAHALSLLCRGNGHVRTFFSVGQHCILCAKEAEARGYSGRLILAALLHDASECYMSDVPRPFKKSLPEYRSFKHYLSEISRIRTFCHRRTEAEGDRQWPALVWPEISSEWNTGHSKTGCPCSDPIPAIPFFTGGRGISEPF